MNVLLILWIHRENWKNGLILALLAILEPSENKSLFYLTGDKDARKDNDISI